MGRNRVVVLLAVVVGVCRAGGNEAEHRARTEQKEQPAHQDGDSNWG